MGSKCWSIWSPPSRKGKPLPADSILELPLDSKWKQSFRQRLRRWYGKHRRELPWRKTRDPYAVWVSEIMLQQTQVETVRPYFERFMSAFPTVTALAEVKQEEVLRLWEGLGYYRRARQMHDAARKIAVELDGVFPQTVAALQQLPGVGRYTAGAIVSIAFDQPAPILEANTIRLLSRVLGYRKDPTKTPGQKLLWAMAGEILPRKNVADFNQALMELGSLVCRPSSPICDDCPIQTQCAACQAGLQSKIPVPKRKKPLTDLHEVAVVVTKNKSVLLRQCAEGERWAGLWDFPRFEMAATLKEPSSVCSNRPPSTDHEIDHVVHDEIVEKVHALTGITCLPGTLLQTIKHGVTRYRITLDCYTAQYALGRIRPRAAKPVRWTPVGELGNYALSTTGRKIARSIAIREKDAS